MASTHDNLVLCYHALSPTWQAELATTPERFERQVSLLLRRGYRCVSFSEAVFAPPRSGVLAITFDDAFRSVFAFARPILERLGATATLFVPTDYIDTGKPLHWAGIDRWQRGPFQPELVPMSWAEIRALAAGGWEIGSHTGSHPHLTQIGDKALEAEMTRSRSVCEAQLERACTSIAYPYGDVDARVARAAEAAGYLAGAALPGAFGTADRLRWPRIGVYQLDDDRRFRLKVSVLVRLRSHIAWQVIEAARRGIREPAGSAPPTRKA